MVANFYVYSMWPWYPKDMKEQRKIFHCSMCIIDSISHTFCEYTYLVLNDEMHIDIIILVKIFCFTAHHGGRKQHNHQIVLGTTENVGTKISQGFNQRNHELRKCISETKLKTYIFFLWEGGGELIRKVLSLSHYRQPTHFIKKHGVKNSP